MVLLMSEPLLRFVHDRLNLPPHPSPLVLTIDDVAVESILDVGCIVVHAKQQLCVGLILREEQRRLSSALWMTSLVQFYLRHSLVCRGWLAQHVRHQW